MHPDPKRHQRFFKFSLLLLTSILAFLAGYGFQSFLTNTEFGRKNHRRDLGDQLPSKRNFESRDRSPADVANEDMLYHQNGLKQVSNSTLKEFLK